MLSPPGVVVGFLFVSVGFYGEGKNGTKVQHCRVFLGSVLFFAGFQ